MTGHVCAAWAQPGELPVNAQDLHTEGPWCAILAMASDILWSASGRRWRNVQASETVTLDPETCGCVPLPGWPAGVRYGYVDALVWDDPRPRKIRLPRPDVTAVTAVTLSGSTFSAWRLGGNWLYRTDGQTWPLANTTQITYQFGRLIPSGANLAAILLATELGKAMAGKACALPARVTSVTRQGITFDALESLEVLKEGLTGIHAVDSWILSVNRTRTTQPAVVWSPDVVEARPV